MLQNKPSLDFELTAMKIRETLAQLLQKEERELRLADLAGSDEIRGTHLLEAEGYASKVWSLREGYGVEP